MRFITVERLESGMKTEVPIINANGRLVIKAGKTLTNDDIEKIKGLVCIGVYIQDKKHSFKNNYMDNCLEEARSIVTEVLKIDNVHKNLQLLKQADECTFRHSVNVGTIATTLSILSNNTMENNYNSCIAGLLHDVGKIKISKEILTKNGKLNTTERLEIEKHSELSYNIVAKEGFESVICEAILNHHEQEDGSGYPRGLNGNQIGDIGKIIHIADVYDAIVKKRYYKEARTPDKAIDILINESGSSFDINLVDLFITNYPVYSIGTELLAKMDNKNHTATVIENEIGNITRPVLETKDGIQVDMKKHKNEIKIIEVLS